MYGLKATTASKKLKGLEIAPYFGGSMKKFLFLGLLLGSFAKADFSPLEYGLTGDLRISTALSRYVVGERSFTYDVAKDGGSVGAHVLHMQLPNNAVIIRSFLQVNTAFASASQAGTVALSCQTANNIKTATDISGSAAGAMVEGESTGAASAFKRLTANCTVTATIANYALTSGKLKAWVQYVMGR